VAVLCLQAACGEDWSRQLGGVRGVAIGAVDGPYVKNGEGSTVQLRDGRILHAFTRHEANTDLAPAVVAETSSADGGLTWTRPAVMFRSTTGKNAMQPGFVRMKNGKLGVSYSRIDSADRATKVFRYSSDEGKTWSEEILISPAASYWTSAHDRMVCLGNGRIAIPLHHKTALRPEQMTTQVAYSDDNGRSWKLSADKIVTSAMLPAYAAKHASNSAPGFWEGSIVERRDGSLLLLGRTYAGFQYRSVSVDQGVHWSQSDPTTLPSAAAPARVERIPGTGDLLVLWNSCCINTDDGLLGQRLTLSSAISSDGGKTWHKQRDIEALIPAPLNRVEYPAITFVADRAYITYRINAEVAGKSEMQEYLSILPVSWFYVGNPEDTRQK
jgi:Neuraminidase (sialidase)